MYARFFKRLFDALLSLVALLALSPLLLILIVAGAIAFGGKPFFLQPRPGRGERVFYMLKFRSMNDKRDQNGKLLPDGGGEGFLFCQLIQRFAVNISDFGHTLSPNSSMKRSIRPV